MDVKRAAAAVTVVGAVGATVAVGLILSVSWALLAGSLFLLAAGVSSLRSPNG